MAKTARLGRAAVGTLQPAMPGLGKQKSTPRMRDSANRLEQIRKIGCHLLYRSGYAGMTMREIAASLRIKAASLYYHFPSKQDILFDLMRSTALELIEGLRQIAQSEKEPAEQLDAAIRWHVLFHTQKREESFVSHSELRSLERHNLQAILKLRREYELLFDTILKRALRTGAFHVEDISVARNCILPMCTAPAGWYSPRGRLSAEQVADRIRNLVWTALAPRNGNPSPDPSPDPGNSPTK
ncbi:MAG: TetR/AcrR family transcriptional regulator [Acidobacteria bacterium]|nr:TetR/AcrR family transcriptional regulator [Acidobacteriota bacterium]